MSFKKHKKSLLLAMIVIIAILMILNLSYSLYGSLESFPTDEQNEKVKLFSGLTFFILLLVEAALIHIFRKESSLD